MGSQSLLQGIFPNQGLNPGLPQCTQFLYELSHQGSPRGKRICLQCRRCEFDPWVGRFLRAGIGNPLQSSYLGNSMHRGTWWATVYEVARAGHDLVTKQHFIFVLPVPIYYLLFWYKFLYFISKASLLVFIVGST